MAKALNYQEFMDYARAHYTKGGDVYCETMEDYEFYDFVDKFGPITKRAALKMFKFQRDVAKEYGENM